MERQGITLTQANEYMIEIASHLRKIGKEVIFSGDTIRVKPHLDPFRLMFDQIEVVPQEEFFIEESEDPLLDQNTRCLYSGDF